MHPTPMATVNLLTQSMDALAALGALLRARTEGLALDPKLSGRLELAAASLGVPASLPAAEQRAMAGAIRAFFRQAHDLLEDPARPFGWTHEDPAFLNAQGRGSMMAADAIRAVAPSLAGLERALAGPDAAFLDIGCGVAWLTIALARAFPAARVTGLDLWCPALRLAEQNVAASECADRITIRWQDAGELADAAAFDAVWLPGPFLSLEACMRAVPRVREALRPGGWLLFGLYGGAADPLGETLAAVRTLRSGGHPWTLGEAAELLRIHGFVDAGPVEHGLAAPLRLVAARVR